MNDSFLEEIGLVGQPTGCVVRGAERHITTRRSNSPRSVVPAEQAEWDLFIKQQKPIEISTPKMPKSSRRSVDEINSELKTPLIRRPSETININNNNNNNSNKKSAKDKSPGTKVKNSAKKNKITDVKLKTVENVDQQQIQSNNKNRLKVSVSSSDNSRLSDNSTKENSRPLDGSGDSINNSDKIKEHKKKQNDNNNINKKFNSSDGAESFAMLNAIKEVVSSYTKIESNKIMRMMQDLHINSQSNMIKQMLSLSDDVKEQNLGINSGRFQSLVQENAKLLDNINYLKNRVDELQKSQEDYDKLRQENSMLKIRLCDYEKK